MDYGDQFSGKICVITGAGSGIGRALAIKLEMCGAVLALSDINEVGLEETHNMLNSSKNRILLDALDVSEADAIPLYAQKVKSALGGADFVFNVAGLTRVGSFEETPLSSFEKIMDVNFYGPVRMSKAFLPQLRATRGGLINISSIFGIIGFKGQTHYCASKFGLRGFNETLSQELEGTGVSVTSVHPGGVATNIAKNAKIDAMPDTGQSETELHSSFDKAAITSPEKAADIILAGTAKRRKRVIVGPDARLIQFISRVFPVRYVSVLKRIAPDVFKAL